MSSLRRIALPLLCLTLLAVPFLADAQSGPARRAPDFTLQRMNGDAFQLSDHRGEIVVVNFWATWCPPCTQEIPGFVRLQKEFRAQGVTFVGVSLDKGGFDQIRPFAKRLNINYPIVRDTKRVARRYGGVRVLPATFVIGPEGRIRHHRSGFFPERQLRDRLEALLEQTGRSEAS